MAELIYYLPGWSGQLSTGLGQGLLDRGYDVTGRETRNEFAEMRFFDQVNAVKNDLTAYFWRSTARVVVNSFGGYLFLHAQAEMEPFPGKVLLFSPVVGGFNDEEIGRFFSPPYQDKLLELAVAKKFPAPLQCEVHTGSEDWKSHPDAVTQFFGLIGVDAVIAQGRGHMLGADYVGATLDRWLASADLYV